MPDLRVLLTLLLLVGCAPSLSNPPPAAADDDDATGDDDDSTVGDDDDDDDDATWGDDDDIVDPSCTNPGTGEAWVTGPPELSGTWTAGSVTVDQDAQSVSVTTEDGLAYTWRVGDDVALLAGADGFGRVYWELPGLGAWGGDFVFAVETNDGSYRFLSALVAWREEVFIPDWGALFFVDPGACGELIEDTCGLLQVLPMTFEVPSWDGVMSGTLYPGEGMGTGDFTMNFHRGQQYLELACDDVDALLWSFSMQQAMVIWDG